MQTFKIANKLISNNSKTFIIAEIGLAHMGSLNIAHSFIDAAAKFGADAVKFQLFTIPNLYSIISIGNINLILSIY